MVAYKAAQTPRFLANPDTDKSAVLLYGPEPGLVGDRAGVLAKMLAAKTDPPGEIVRLDERDLAEDPDRLAIEAQTISMFASHRIIRIQTGSRLNMDLLSSLIASGHEAFLIVEAGNLRPTAKLRKLFEGARAAAALPCYSDAARDMGPMIDLELGQRGVAITPEAKTTLLALIGSDPALARSEIEKLSLYAGDKGPIDVSDVEAIIAESGELALDALAQSVADRARDATLRQLDRLSAAGQSAQGGLAYLARHFEALHRLSAEIEHGLAPDRALSKFKPPLSYSQRDALTRQARLWSRPQIQRVIVMLQKAIAESRRRPNLERQIAERLILKLCG